MWYYKEGGRQCHLGSNITTLQECKLAARIEADKIGNFIRSRNDTTLPSGCVYGDLPDEVYFNDIEPTETFPQQYTGRICKGITFNLLTLSLSSFCFFYGIQKIKYF